MALIEIGSTKQLFIDDYLVESMTNTSQVLNPAQKVDGNPVLRPERPWEGTVVRMGGALSRGVFYDREEGEFKMFYETIDVRAKRANGQIELEEGESHACLAVSEDGVEWDRPNLGLFEYDGSTNNNIVPPDRYMHFLFYDEHETDPSRRFKGFKRWGLDPDPGYDHRPLLLAKRPRLDALRGQPGG